METTTEERFSAKPHHVHGDWSVYDAQRELYWVRGCTQEEAEAGAVFYNQKFSA